ncbi:ATP-dependent protease La LON substrate-binding domain containing protein [Nitzschia inconspicua]|uniref:ATP-dependent protease La LON substrate-binding domain containing protein n=1 Tax=Nitzschia inconspicua TaxID=303405 RepID=A0A9K3PE56_9STRA|nr:ATP-dependent protease La LON substrate-binding domain containing protein [Nitzschia inconspicua]
MIPTRLMLLSHVTVVLGFWAIALSSSNKNRCMAFQSRYPIPFTTRTRIESYSTSFHSSYRQGRKSMPFTCLFYKSSNRSNSNSNNSNNSNMDDLNNHPFNRRRQQEESEAMAFQKHMEQVRSLQMSFYTTSTSFMDNPKQPACQLQMSTGRLLQLPLWRDAQWHVPGRSNVLEITDPVYTHMFESILYKPQPWCFGHLYLEEPIVLHDSKSNAPTITPLSKAEQPLYTWENTPTSLDPKTTAAASTHTSVTSAAASSSSSAVLGCLMHIADYRRMSDGRLLILAHAMERFVVTDVVRQLPYSVVHAQILPDTEEIDPLLLDVLNPQLLEADLAEARAMAVQESVQFHAYEYDPHHSFSTTVLKQPTSRLAGDMNSSNFVLPPLPPQQQLQIHECLSPADIAKVLPFCPFAKIPLDEAKSRSNAAKAAAAVEEVTDDNRSTSNSAITPSPEQNEPSLEYRLLHRGILKVPPIDPDFSATSSHSMSIEELEHELWLAMNYFLVTTKLPVSPILLSLLPPLKEEQKEKWPQDFLLYKVANDLEKLESMEHDFVPVPQDYPAYRRQRRLSFSAAYLLEDYYESKLGDAKEGQSLKKLLLSIPSTKQRLRVVLEKFLQWQQQTWGEFQ